MFLILNYEKTLLKDKSIIKTQLFMLLILFKFILNYKVRQIIEKFENAS